MAKQIVDLQAQLGQTTAKADRALDGLQRLKLDRKLVLDLKQGAFFGIQFDGSHQSGQKRNRWFYQ